MSRRASSSAVAMRFDRAAAAALVSARERRSAASAGRTEQHHPRDGGPVHRVPVRQHGDSGNGQAPRAGGSHRARRDGGAAKGLRVPALHPAGGRASLQSARAAARRHPARGTCTSSRGSCTPMSITRSKYDAKPDLIDVTYVIDEGPPTLVRSIAYAGEGGKPARVPPRRDRELGEPHRVRAEGARPDGGGGAAGHRGANRPVVPGRTDIPSRPPSRMVSWTPPATAPT